MLCGGREEWEGKAGRDMKITELGSVEERTRSYEDELREEVVRMTITRDDIVDEGTSTTAVREEETDRQRDCQAVMR
jgi:hypothetical protein